MFLVNPPVQWVELETQATHATLGSWIIRTRNAACSILRNNYAGDLGAFPRNSEWIRFSEESACTSMYSALQLH
jgi:hypothetical protein